MFPASVGQALRRRLRGKTIRGDARRRGRGRKVKGSIFGIPAVAYSTGARLHLVAVWSGPVVISSRCGRSGLASRSVSGLPLCDKCRRHWEKWHGSENAKGGAK